VPPVAARSWTLAGAHRFSDLLVFLTPTILSSGRDFSSILALVGFAYAAYIIGAVFVVETLLQAGSPPTPCSQ
jgi:hypothetical protein